MQSNLNVARHFFISGLRVVIPSYFMPELTWDRVFDRSVTRNMCLISRFYWLGEVPLPSNCYYMKTNILTNDIHQRIKVTDIAYKNLLKVKMAMSWSCLTQNRKRTGKRSAGCPGSWTRMASDRADLQSAEDGKGMVMMKMMKMHTQVHTIFLGF